MSTTNSELTLILASTSRYRAGLLMRLGIPFATASSGADETPLPAEEGAHTARRLALAKAAAVRPLHPGALIIGSDQVAVCAGVRLDKPGSHGRAVEQLRHASGKTVDFLTAVAVLNSDTGTSQVEVVPTRVRFRNLTDHAIERYLQREPAYDCAGSAKAEGLGISLIESIESNDPTALIGLPLIALVRMLSSEGLHIP